MAERGTTLDPDGPPDSHRAGTIHADGLCSPDASASAADPTLQELRALIIAPEQHQLADIRNRLDTLSLTPEQVSAVLPQAVVLRSHQDRQDDNRQLSDALMPTIEAAIQTTVRSNPAALVEALFPVIGAAIRKALGAALKDMLQSLSQSIDHSFTLQGLRWRLDALRTGKSFAEVVLLNTLVYQVDEVFLIHRETGLMLQHAAIDSAVTQDSDMVSGMMSAIQDFVQDSFGGTSDSALDNLEVGNLQVWFERGPSAVLAAVIRGTAPQDLRVVLQEAIESIHLSHGALLTSFDGDTSAFDSTRPILEDCLRVQRSAAAARQRISPAVWLIGAVVILALFSWLVANLIQDRRWSHYLDTLERTPGVVVTRSGWRGGRFHVSGLRDPLAVDPTSLLAPAGLSPRSVASHWEPYLSFEPEFVASRAHKLLSAPPSVKLSFRDGVLTASGAAPHTWIQQASQNARFIPGIVGFHTSSVVDESRRTLQRANDSLKQELLLFQADEPVLVPGEASTLKRVADRIEGLILLGRELGVRLEVVLVGHADGSNTTEMSSQLRQQRAIQAKRALKALGVPGVNLVAQPGPPEPLFPHTTANAPALNRSVTFQIRETPLSSPQETP